MREGHGDLHSRHVCLIRPPIIVDCIEFNKRFRIGDVLEDIGFLLMDLEYRGRFDLSAAFSHAYFSLFPEAASPELLRFYKVYRAVVRGKIEGFTADALADQPDKQAAERRAREYYLLARHYIENGDRPFNPVVFMGVSGSGKSAIAQGLIGQAVLIRSDRVRKRDRGRAGRRAHLRGLWRGHIRADVTSAGLPGHDPTDGSLRRIRTKGRCGRYVPGRFPEAGILRDVHEGRAEPILRSLFCGRGDAQTKDRAAHRRKGGPLRRPRAVLERQLLTAEEPVELPSFRVLRLDTTGEKPEDIQQALRRFL